MKLGFVSSVAAVSTAVVLVFAGCSSEDTDQASDSIGSAADAASSAAASIAANAGERFDDAKAEAFVVAFRAQFGALAENRDDNAIKQLLSRTCTEIAGGADESAVVAELETQAASGGTQPTTEEAQRIYDQAKIACS